MYIGQLFREPNRTVLFNDKRPGWSSWVEQSDPLESRLIWCVTKFRHLILHLMFKQATTKHVDATWRWLFITPGKPSKIFLVCTQFQILSYLTVNNDGNYRLYGRHMDRNSRINCLLLTPVSFSNILKAMIILAVKIQQSFSLGGHWKRQYYEQCYFFLVIKDTNGMIRIPTGMQLDVSKIYHFFLFVRANLIKVSR